MKELDKIKSLESKIKAHLVFVNPFLNSREDEVFRGKTFYMIDPQGFNRSSQVDRFYITKYKSIILAAFGNCCAICGTDEGITLDHFYICKNHGGSFLLESFNGERVNNAVPMCQKCNSRKGIHNYETLYDARTINKINTFNQLAMKAIKEKEKEECI